MSSFFYSFILNAMLDSYLIQLFILRYIKIEFAFPFRTIFVIQLFILKGMAHIKPFCLPIIKLLPSKLIGLLLGFYISNITLRLQNLLPGRS